MAKLEDDDALERFVRLMNKGHGYGGTFNYENARDKRYVELDTANEWSRSMVAEFGVELGMAKPNLNDPPDCYFNLRGRQIGVELVQLVEQKHKNRAQKSETPHHGKLFMDMQWSKERFLAKVNQTIGQKGQKYELRSIEVDVLVIFVGEPFLNFVAAKELLKDSMIGSHQNIRNAYMLFDYEPGRGVDHWPMLPIYGDLRIY